VRSRCQAQLLAFDAANKRGVRAVEAAIAFSLTLQQADRGGASDLGRR